MYLVSQEPKLEIPTNGPQSFAVELNFSLRLRCPVCDNVHFGDIKGGCLMGWRKRNTNLLQISIIDAVERAASSHQACTACGVVSVIPREDRENLLNETKNAISMTRVQEAVDEYLK